MRVVLASARSSPGVTTAMLAFASICAGKVLLVEASEDGGALAPRFGLRLEPGLATLAAAIRHQPDPSLVAEHTQLLPGADGRIAAVVGPSTPEAAQPLLRTIGERLAGTLAGFDDSVVFIDAGRLPPAPAAVSLLTGADRFVVVARPRVEELQTLAHRLPVLRELGTDPHVLLVGREPYGPEEVAATIDVPVIGALADDRATAKALAGVAPPRRLTRTPLLRSAASLLNRLVDAPAQREPSASPAPGQPTVGRAGWASATVWSGQGGDR